MKSKNRIEVPDSDTALYERIRELVVAARNTVARGVDLVQVHTSFQIGCHIIEQEQQGEQRASYGKAVLKALAEKLTQEFGRGFSKSNLEYMRRFYLLYQERAAIAQCQTGQLDRLAEDTRAFRLSWTHYVFLMGLDNIDERNFYEIEASDQGWNLNELKRQFNSGLYERLALSRDKEGIRQLAHQNLGQMQMYVNYFDRYVKTDGENATIGIILCKKKNEALVEITLPKDANIHAREYQLYLPSKEELRQKLQEWAGEEA